MWRTFRFSKVRPSAPPPQSASDTAELLHNGWAGLFFLRLQPTSNTHLFTNMSLGSFMALSAAYSSVLTPEILLKISAFITYAPRFKDDIILVQAADWPLDIAPPYLPQSIALLLSNLCEASEEAIEMLWIFFLRCYGHLQNKSFRNTVAEFTQHGLKISTEDCDLSKKLEITVVNKFYWLWRALEPRPMILNRLLIFLSQN